MACNWNNRGLDFKGIFSAMKTKEKPISEPPKMVLPPKTTAAEDETAAGQRRVHILWESTQAIVAVMITGAVIYNAVNKIESPVLTNAFFLIVSMYFVRTNHTLTSGVSQAYKGR